MKYEDWIENKISKYEGVYTNIETAKDDPYYFITRSITLRTKQGKLFASYSYTAGSNHPDRIRQDERVVESVLGEAIIKNNYISLNEINLKSQIGMDDSAVSGRFVIRYPDHKAAVLQGLVLGDQFFVHQEMPSHKVN